MTTDDVGSVDALCRKFVDGYHRLYYAGNDERMSVIDLDKICCLGTADIDKRKRIASYDTTSPSRWVNVADIVGPIRVLREGAVNMVITDVDVYN